MKDSKIKDVTQHPINNAAVAFVMYSFCQKVHDLKDCPSEPCDIGITFIYVLSDKQNCTNMSMPK